MATLFLFLLLLFLILYGYVIYPVILFLFGWNRFLKIKKTTNPAIEDKDLPSLTLLVTAYNEKHHVDEKIENSKALAYPPDKLNLVWVTDGSNDGTPDMVKKHQGITLYHLDERKGKIHAMNRAVRLCTTDIIVFCDANTLLTTDTLLKIACHFQNPRVGCVAGEKQIINKNRSAAAAGEGFYWKYESILKQLDYAFHTTLGAAGELFAVRKKLFTGIEQDTILDDFIISIRIALQGYKVAYEPKAIAQEYPSSNVDEEMKRKVRIAAGGFQALTRLKGVFNIFKNPELTFQFVSHKIFRWVICPFALLLLIPVNIFTCLQYPDSIIIISITALHILFYILAVTGRLLEKKRNGIGILNLPYYFLSSNIAQLRGLVRYLSKSQSVNWERVKRASK